MRRFIFYFSFALITFGSSTFAGFLFFENKENCPANSKKFSSQTIKVESYSISEPERFSPTYIQQEKDDQKSRFCRDKAILPVWNLIKKDRYFREQSGGLFENSNCTDMFEVLKIDLNRDGKKEILLRGNSLDLCGAVGNCGFWIFEKKGKTYRKILSASDYVDITEMGDQMTRRRTNGYYDILLKDHWNSSDTIHATYSFDGQKYVRSKCLVDYYIRGTSPNEKWKFITCREHAKLEGY